MAQVGGESCLQYRIPRFNYWVGKIRWKWDRLPTPALQGFLCGSAGKEPACNVGDLDLIPGLGRSPKERKGYPLQYSGLENSKDCTVHGVAKIRTRLSDFYFHFCLVSLRVSPFHFIVLKVQSFCYVYLILQRYLYLVTDVIKFLCMWRTQFQMYYKKPNILASRATLTALNRAACLLA